MTHHEEILERVSPALAEPLQVVHLEAEAVAADLTGMPGAVHHLAVDGGRDVTALVHTLLDRNDAFRGRGRSRDGSRPRGSRRAHRLRRTRTSSRARGFPPGLDLVE